MNRYKLELTADDIQAIRFVGARYGWSFWLLNAAGEGSNEFAEHELWEFKEAVDSDSEGGHSRFPLLSPKSGLYGKLDALVESIV